MKYDIPDHPVIARMERSGYLIDDEENDVREEYDEDTLFEEHRESSLFD